MKTAKVCVDEVRVLWLHSAAWMASETVSGSLRKGVLLTACYIAEDCIIEWRAYQLNVVGHLPFEFDNAGSSVAVAKAIMVATLSSCLENIISRRSI